MNIDENFATQAPINDDVMRAFFYGDIFKPEECDHIQSLPGDPALTAHFETLQRAEMTGYAHYMQAAYELLALPEASQWLSPYVHTLFHALNDKHYHFALGKVMGLQRVCLRPGSTLDWHLDLGNGLFAQRKLSLVVWLNAPHEYSGGFLELMAHTPPGSPRSRGTIAIFPAFMANRISPVTAGELHLLLAWMHSDAPFR